MQAILAAQSCSFNYNGVTLIKIDDTIEEEDLQKVNCTAFRILCR